MIKRVMIIIPPNIVPQNTLRRIGEPIGAIMIATYLQSKGFDLEVFDMTLEGYDNCEIRGDFLIYGSTKEALITKLHEFRPDIVGISSMFSSKEELTLNVAASVKRYNPQLPVVVGGMPPTIHPEAYLRTGDIDFVIMHDGEIRFEKLINNLNTSRPPITNMDGLAYYENGKLIVLPAKKLNEYFCIMPVPDRSLVNMEGYLKIGKPYSPFTQGRRVAHLVASKGCPFNCIFCAAVNFVGHKVHLRPIDSIVSEIKSLIEQYNIEEIQFMDDNLTIDKAFSLELFKKIAPFNLKWCTPNGLFFNSLDDELLEAMKKSGCYQITLAIESGSQRVLKEVVKKNVDLSRVKQVVDKAHSLGLWVHGLFVVGLIGETRDEIFQTLKFPFNNNFDSMSISIANAFKGSRLYNICKEKGYPINNHTQVSYKQTNFDIPTDSPDYVISKKELEILVDETTQNFFQWSKKTFPEINKQKYDTFIDRSAEDSDKIKHRI